MIGVYLLYLAVSFIFKCLYLLAYIDGLLCIVPFYVVFLLLYCLFFCLPAQGQMQMNSGAIAFNCALSLQKTNNKPHKVIHKIMQ